MRQVAAASLAAIAAIVLLALSAAFFDHSAVFVLRTLAEGSVGSAFALQATVLKSIPLLFTGLAIVIAFRAGAWNIGAEGQFIVGGLAAFVASPYGVIVSLVAAAAAGAAWATIASVMRIWRNAPEVLTTILLNFVAIHLLGWCVNGPLREASGQYPQTDLAQVALPRPYGTLIALAAALGAWWLLFRTTEGLRLRASGFNPDAATYAGIRVRAQLARAMAMSGALAGLAGGVELLAVSHRLFERFAAGYGYSGIAVALLAQLHPLGSVAAAFFFGALASGAGELQRSANISIAIATLGQAVVILFVVAFTARTWSRADA